MHVLVDNGTYPTSTIGTELRHQDGGVDMEFNTPGTIEQNVGGGNAFYDKDLSGGATASPNDTNFGYRNGSYNRYCYSTYCHGDGLPSAGFDTTPQWNSVTTADCGDCHQPDWTGLDITSGNHGVHMGPHDALGNGIVPSLRKMRQSKPLLLRDRDIRITSFG